MISKSWFIHKVFSNHTLYMVNGPRYLPTESEFKNDVNNVLKQAVAGLDTTIIKRIDKMDWDINGNGVVDWPVGFALTQYMDLGNQVIFNELNDLLEKEPFEFCKSNMTSATFIIKGPIRMHYILTEDAHVGDTVLTLYQNNNFTSLI